MRKAPKPSRFVDLMHKGFVCACVGVTLYGSYYLGWRAYRFFTVVKPEQQRRELLMKQNLLAEGSSENLIDVAPIQS